MLHSVGDEWDLADPAQRRTLTDRASAACRAAQAVSRASRAAHRGAALAGRPHGGGRRAFGYESGMGEVIPAESKVVREVFARFLDGETLRAIAFDLNDRNVPTALGSAWTVGGVGRILDAPRYAGIRVFRGQVRADDGGYLRGAWEPCVSIEDWERVRTLRAEHAPRPNPASSGAGRSGYLLTGLVECMACGHSMVGSVVGGYRMYACASTRNQPPEECARSIGATSFELHVQQDAIRILQEWDAARIASLPMVGNRRPDLRAHEDGEHVAFGAVHGGVVVRSASAIEGITIGPDAGQDWSRVPMRRRAEVLRFLYTVIRVGPKTTSRGSVRSGADRLGAASAVGDGFEPGAAVRSRAVADARQERGPRQVQGVARWRRGSRRSGRRRCGPACRASASSVASSSFASSDPSLLTAGCCT